MNRALGNESGFLEPSNFPWVHAVEGMVDGIREELDALLPRLGALPNFQDVQQDQMELTRDDRWKIFPFYGYGMPYEPNLKRCPKTAAALSRIPGMRSAMFSILRGPKQLPPHRGPFNGVLRYHLTLRVPGDTSKCRIRVGSEWRSWTEGKSLVFDDTFEHEVINELEGPRAVLFVDFLRPAPEWLSRRNEQMVQAIAQTPFIQDALRKIARWNVDFESKSIE